MKSSSLTRIKTIRLLLFICIPFLTSSCTGLPKGVEPVDDFELNRYLGTWYEIARLDHSFERGLEQVTANYSLRDDGGVRVINKGYVKEKNKWKEAEGKAYFVDAKNKGHLKVSFFGPFYGSYVVYELDHENYQYAYIAGYNQSYLWLLARTPQIEKERIEDFKQQAKKLGFDITQLILVNHK